MKQPINRREFITASTAVAAGLGLGAGSSAAQTPAGPGGGGAVAQAPAAPAAPLTFKTKPHKALIARPTEDDLKRMKDVGFEGVEGRSSVTPEEAAKMRVIADKLGMRIHSVLIDKWGEFNSPDKSVVDASFADSQAALRTAEAFGADTVLLVPAASAVVVDGARRKRRPCGCRAPGSSRSSSTRTTDTSRGSSTATMRPTPTT